MTDIDGMKAELDGLVREQAERRALREQRGEEIKARSHEYMTKQVQAAERYVHHLREVAKRRTKSGWSTDRSPEPVPQEEPRRRPRAARIEDDDEFVNNPW
ncbi:hypothetical protein ABJI51_12515 [Amycolatopsis sp. NEAU-NG30]|uniref:Uncharacterized protein n=1 Tax=Amycolatopsis melonis TaxID=3156488 RepID=A0ABV0LC67_9PSEU